MIMAKRRDNLWQHGRKYYLKYGIPRPLQHMFLSGNGKPMSHVVEPLASDYDVAKLKAKQRIAELAAVFDAIKAGAITTPAQAKDAIRARSAYETELRDRNEAVGRWGEAWREAERRLALERQAVWFETYGRFGPGGEPHDRTKQPAPITTGGETINQAAEAWYAELTRDETTAPRDTTLGGHRLRVRAFVDATGDLPLTDVTRVMASDFLDGLKVKNRTRNQYARTLASVFKSARLRGRYQGEKGQSPFDDQRAKVVGSSYEPFTVDELQKLFDAMPRETKPKKHTPDTALPWVALMALYTGMRLEEVAQLTVADIREETANGARVWCVDVHNGGSNKLKNETSARLIPIHSELVRLGLLDYMKALKAGPLFPGLTRRASKGNKVGARVGELFRKKLVALDLKCDGLCFHSFRHTVAGRLDAAGVPQSDAARVLGHAVAGMSYGTYSQAGPGLKRVAGVVEQIAYDGLRL
jgi:integrase